MPKYSCTNKYIQGILSIKRAQDMWHVEYLCYDFCIIQPCAFYIPVLNTIIIHARWSSVVVEWQIPVRLYVSTFIWTCFTTYRYLLMYVEGILSWFSATKLPVLRLNYRLVRLPFPANISLASPRYRQLIFRRVPVVEVFDFGFLWYDSFPPSGSP